MSVKPRRINMGMFAYRIPTSKVVAWLCKMSERKQDKGTLSKKLFCQRKKRMVNYNLKWKLKCYITCIDFTLTIFRKIDDIRRRGTNILHTAKCVLMCTLLENDRNSPHFMSLNKSSNWCKAKAINKLPWRLVWDLLIVYVYWNLV